VDVAAGPGVKSVGSGIWEVVGELPGTWGGGL
jgi:hypothetical protein